MSLGVRRRRSSAGSRKTGPIHAITLSLAVSTSCYAAPPAVEIETAPLVTPEDAFNYYSSQAGATSSAAPATRDPLVQEVSRALRYDVDLIYQYARDNVEFIPQFGLLKGARGVIVDGYGTAFDQAQFMVEALREADAVARTAAEARAAAAGQQFDPATLTPYTPRFVFGDMTVSGAEFASWTGVNDANQARKLLGNGGIPAVITINGSNFSVRMLHVWVRVAIDGRIYYFDPSFKGHSPIPAKSWKTATTYSLNNLQSGLSGSATSVVGFDAATLRGRLDTYRSQLENFIVSNAAGMKTDFLVGDNRIIPHPASEDRQTALPKVTSTRQTWNGQIPNIYRTSYSVSMNGQTYGTFYSDQTGGQMYRFTYGYSNVTSSFSFGGSGRYSVPIIAGPLINDCEQFIGTRQGASTATAAIVIDHPYAAGGGTYADRTIDRQVALKQCAVGSFYVSNDWGPKSDGMSRRMQSAASAIRNTPNNNLDVIVAPGIDNVVQQFSSTLKMAEKVIDGIYQIHDIIGIHTIDNASTQYNNGAACCSYGQSTFTAMDFEAAISPNVPETDVASFNSAAFLAGLGLSIAETAAPLQESDAVYDMSALSLITQQDARAPAGGPYSTYLVSPFSWASRPSLANYPAEALATLQTYNATNGFSVLIPQQGSLRQPPITINNNVGSPATTKLWEGYSLVAGSTYDGGEMKRTPFLAFKMSTGTSPAVTHVALAMHDPRRGGVLKAGVGVPIEASLSSIRRPDAPVSESGDPIRSGIDVDGRSGSLSYRPAADLRDGWGEFPFSLTLQRRYDQRDATNYGFGAGWQHNWVQTATLSNDGQAALGKGPAVAAASALVALTAMRDLLKSADAKSLYSALQVASWLTDQTINNSVSIKKGLDGGQSFYKLQGGEYISADGSGEQLAMSGPPPQIGIINRRLYPGMTLSYTDKSGSVRTYATPVVPSGYDLSSSSIAALYGTKTAQMTQWSFPNGVLVGAQYTTVGQATAVIHPFSIWNNLGRRIVRTNYDPGSLSGDYYCPATGTLPLQGPSRNATISYATSDTSSAGATFSMEAQANQQFIGDPDAARCNNGARVGWSIVPQQLTSRLLNYVNPVGGTWSFNYDPIINMFTGSPLSDGFIGSYSLSRIRELLSVQDDALLTYGLDNNIRSIQDSKLNLWQYFSTAYRSEVLSPAQSMFINRDPIPVGPGSGLHERPSRGAVGYYDNDGRSIMAVDALGALTTTSYDERGNPVLTVRPEGDSVSTTYDARNNVLSVTRHAKPGSGLADISEMTSYTGAPDLAECASATNLNAPSMMTCNLPVLQKDSNGGYTSYIWSSWRLVRVLKGVDSVGACISLTSCTSVNYYYLGIPGVDGSGGSGVTGTVTLPESKLEKVGGGLPSVRTLFEYANSPKIVPKGVVVDSDPGGLGLRSCFTFDASGNLISKTEPRGNITNSAGAPLTVCP